MNTRKRANIQVGANWEAFGEKCQKEGKTRTQLINDWINAYLATSATIASKAPQGYIEDKVTQIVRRELPASMEILAKSLQSWLRDEIDRLGSDLAHKNHLNQVNTDRDNRQPDSLIVNVNSQKEGPGSSKNKSEIPSSQSAFCATIDLSGKTGSKNSKIPASEGCLKANKPAKNLENLKSGMIISNRHLARILKVSPSSPVNWAKRWDSLNPKTRKRLEGFQPTEDLQWRIVKNPD